AGGGGGGGVGGRVPARVAVVDRVEQRLVGAGGLLLQRLRRGRGPVLLFGESGLVRRRFDVRAAGAAVVADLRHVGGLDDGLVVGVDDLDAAEIVDGLVVGEHAAAPLAAEVAGAGVAVAIIDA